jgi:hypothetical protein
MLPPDSADSGNDGAVATQAVSGRASSAVHKAPRSIPGRGMSHHLQRFDERPSRKGKNTRPPPRDATARTLPPAYHVRHCRHRACAGRTLRCRPLRLVHGATREG